VTPEPLEPNPKRPRQMLSFFESAQNDHEVKHATRDEYDERSDGIGQGELLPL
jgi:hypothetical protein